MERKSIFYWADNEIGYVQAVIKASDLSVFEKMGFVSSVDEVKKPKASKKDKGAKDDETVN
ncbi:hypothetical protein QE197_13065 [Arsenophonus nasoniae]|uniref:Phage transcriptional regulator n=1 Tax=Arsenophonus nasoniae TaxID=638 RepID=A0A4P7L649_9GAMM|nr:hypothetical protein [Arsenophonus nasoniae]QBY44412.1 hypothetical protein ArsFIN_29980 [Arsenophonus nasoniae]WGM04671.1 hypothetical protein QE258_13800 [Arsenophonus nasoniae]WGM09785.1 hypothetical protein QE197_13065 [Arsenophonus nasoniae]WGM14504.1 hypothetical protein QE193_12965 [Arsenophonus nasoniae]